MRSLSRPFLRCFGLYEEALALSQLSISSIVVPRPLLLSHCWWQLLLLPFPWSSSSSSSSSSSASPRPPATRIAVLLLLFLRLLVLSRVPWCSGHIWVFATCHWYESQHEWRSPEIETLQAKVFRIWIEQAFSTLACPHRCSISIWEISPRSGAAANAQGADHRAHRGRDLSASCTVAQITSSIAMKQETP